MMCLFFEVRVNVMVIFNLNIQIILNVGNFCSRSTVKILTIPIQSKSPEEIKIRPSLVQELPVRKQQVAKKSSAKKPRNLNHASSYAASSDRHTVQDNFICYYCAKECKTLEHIQRHLRSWHLDEEELLFTKNWDSQTFLVEPTDDS